MKSGDMPAMPTFVAPMLDGGVVEGQYGLTMREYFAGLAMQGILASDNQATITQKICVKLAVEHADALINELGKSS